jgi:hypothetical protein
MHDCPLLLVLRAACVGGALAVTGCVPFSESFVRVDGGFAGADQVQTQCDLNMFRTGSPNRMRSRPVGRSFETTIVYPGQPGTYYFVVDCGGGRTGRSQDYLLNPALRKLSIGTIRVESQ